MSSFGQESVITMEISRFPHLENGIIWYGTTAEQWLFWLNSKTSIMQISTIE